MNDLNEEGLVGLKIIGSRLYWPKIIAMPSAEEFSLKIANKTIQSIKRRGKYIVMSLSDDEFLFIHLRMTGRFILTETNSPQSLHEHAILELDNGFELRFHDTRKFGRWFLTKNPQEVIGHLGFEPLDKDFTEADFINCFKGKKRRLKPLLLDQTMIAGLGNIYVDEALWEAKIHPLTHANELSETSLRNLYQAIQLVLTRGIDNKGTSLGKGKSNFYRLHEKQGSHQKQVKVFRQTNAPCPRCKTLIIRLVVGQRSTHICPDCQKI